MENCQNLFKWILAFPKDLCWDQNSIPGTQHQSVLFVKKHGLEYHFYAGDSQLYLSFKPTDQVTKAEAIRRVEACLKDILSWMQGNMLKQNADKTDVIVFAYERNAGFVNGISMAVGDSNIMEQHVNSVL